MRQTIAGLLCVGLLSTAQAQSVAKAIVPTPVSVAITIGQWLTKDSKKLYYIEVEARADTFFSAKNEGFRLAVEHAVGSLILSESEVKNGKLSRDEIITYSSGYVDNFEIVERFDFGGQTTVKMKVWVAHSAIANRLIGSSTAGAEINGDKISTQISTLTQERQSGVRVLSAVLADFPQRSFDVKVNRTWTSYTGQHQGRLHIDYTIGWNRDYIKSLAESIQAINQRSKCSRYSFRVNCIGTYEVEIIMPGFTSNVYSYFEDPSIEQQFRDMRRLRDPTVLIALKDFDGNTVTKLCHRWLSHRWYYVNFKSNSPANDVQISANLRPSYEVSMDLDSSTIKRINRAEISIVMESECN